MEHVGIDLGSRRSHLVVMNGTGEVLLRRAIETRDLPSWLRARGASRVVMEAWQAHRDRRARSQARDRALRGLEARHSVRSVSGGAPSGLDDEHGSRELPERGRCVCRPARAVDEHRSQLIELRALAGTHQSPFRTSVRGGAPTAMTVINPSSDRALECDHLVDHEYGSPADPPMRQPSANSRVQERAAADHGTRGHSEREIGEIDLAGSPLPLTGRPLHSRVELDRP